jgi:hypothetical protein
MTSTDENQSYAWYRVRVRARSEITGMDVVCHLIAKVSGSLAFRLPPGTSAVSFTREQFEIFSQQADALLCLSDDMTATPTSLSDREMGAVDHLLPRQMIEMPHGLLHHEPGANEPAEVWRIWHQMRANAYSNIARYDQENATLATCLAQQEQVKADLFEERANGETPTS